MKKRHRKKLIKAMVENCTAVPIVAQKETVKNESFLTLEKLGYLRLNYISEAGMHFYEISDKGLQGILE